MISETRKPNSAETPTFIIRPHKGWISINFREIWEYRELLYFLTWRDIKVRYKQTMFGIAWAIMQPLLTMVVFSLFFGTLASVPSEKIPYPLFTYAALVPWTLFANGVTKASSSLVQEAHVIRRIYFPRLLTPMAATLAPLADFVFSLIVLVGLMFYFHYPPTILLLWLPVLLILELALALGVGLWLSAINVEFRDVAFATPFLVQLWLFASPVIYSVNFIPERFQLAYGILNPMSGIIEGFRWAILGTPPPDFLFFASTGVIAFVLITGAFYFRRRERYFADVV